MGGVLLVRTRAGEVARLTMQLLVVWVLSVPLSTPSYHSECEPPTSPRLGSLLDGVVLVRTRAGEEE